MAKTVKAMVYGQEYTLVWNSSTRKYEAEAVAPSDSSYEYNEGHYFPVSISATDEANNTTVISDTVGDFKDNLKFFAKEQIKPTVNEFSPSSDATITTSTPVIEFTVLDNSNGQQTGFAGINPESIILTVGGASVSNSAISKEAVTGGYKCTYIPVQPIADGNCVITVKAADYDGNESDIVSVPFKIDTAPPTLDVPVPADNSYVNTKQFFVELYTSDASPVTVTIDVNGIDQGGIHVDENGYAKVLVTGVEGKNIVTVKSTDAVGKVSTVVRTVTVKTSGPVFKTVEISPNPVNCGKTYTISVSFEDDE